MWTLCLSLWSAMLLFFMMLLDGARGECEVYYLDQPVNHLTCNPNLFGLRLECTVYLANANEYDINWYKIPAGVDRANPQLVNTYKRTNNVYNIGPGAGKILNSRFRIRSPDANHAGIYWCQIVLRDAVNGFNSSFKPSSAFVLHSPAKYSTFPPCSDEDHSQHQTKCATTGEDIVPPSSPVGVTAPSDANASPNQSVTTASSSVRVPQGPSDSMEDPEMNELPPWGYAVIAGGGAVSLIIISVILCILLVFCQNLQKYKARAPLKVIPEAGNATTHGQKQGRPLVPTRTSDIVSSGAKLTPDMTSGCMVTTAFNPFPGPFLNTKYQPGTGGTNVLGERKESPTSNHGDSCSFTSASSAEINDHIYHTINPKRLDTVEVYDAPSNDGSRHDMPPSRSPKPLGLLVPGRLVLAQPKSPPPRLWNSPKSTMCPRTRKLPPIPSSQTSGVATAAESIRGTSPTSGVINLQQSGVCHNNTQYQTLSPETQDYMSLYNAPHTSSVVSLDQ